MAIPGAYSSQIATMRKENPTSFGTDEAAYDWGKQFYNWNDQGTGSSGSSSTTSTGWGDQSKYPDLYSFTPTAAPDYKAPTYGTSTVAPPTLGAAPTYSGPAAFSYGQFSAPDANTLAQDPGYQWRLKQGVAARDASGAARGTVRGGNQLVALEQYGQGLASDEYGNAFNRAAQAYATNYGVARDTYGLANQAAQDQYSRGIAERNAQYQSGADAWGRDQNERQAQFDNAYRATQAEYQPRYASWTADNLAREAVASKNFDAGQRRDEFNRTDAYNRWATGLSDSYRNRALSQDDAQFYADLEESRRRYLSSLGAGLV